MLVFCSDLHLKDDTAGLPLATDQIDLLAERLESIAYQASWRSDGRYEPLQVIDLVLLGDIFEVLQTERWLLKPNGEAETVRPWHDPQGADFIAKVDEIVSAIIANNRAGLDTLVAMAHGERIELPPARRDGQPDEASRERIAVPARIHYLVGNHDWPLHLPGEAYDSIRQKMISAMGLANPASPFPHRAEESPQIEEIFRRHRVIARHGDIFDPINYNPERGRDASTVGDAMTVELLARFPLEVRRQLGDELSPQLSEGIKGLYSVRPALVTPLWLDHLIDNYAPSPDQGEMIKACWDQCAEQFINLDFVRIHDRRFRWDVVDGLEAALLFAKGLSLEMISRLASWANQKLSTNEDISIAKYALEEQALQRGTAQYVVYGHTHFQEVIPLDTRIRAGERVNQVYFNTGTWHRYHELTIRHAAQRNFMSMNVMSYLTFFQGDERGGRDFEVWSGSLASPTLDSGEPSFHR
jgi:UDP-2,3-diacylglucosamine pyrophosphatase LpxH